MTEISRHIECLLLEHNCVIVPSLGGFITHQIPAIYDEENASMSPPKRFVGFNPRLTLNDGLLVQSYMQTYDASYPEAVCMIEGEVAELKGHLHENGNYEIAGVGRLLLSTAGHYDFEPAEARMGTPSLYGLHTYPLQALPHDHSEDEEKENDATPKKHYTFHVNREVANYVSAAIVTLIFYFAWALPSYRDADVKAESSVPHVENIRKVTPEAAKVAVGRKTADLSRTATKEKQVEAPKVAATSEANGDQTVKKENATSKEPAFTLVLATAIPAKNVASFVESLKEHGISSAEVYYQNNLLYIIYGRYDTQMDAWRALKALHKDAAFHDAWILKLSARAH